MRSFVVRLWAPTGGPPSDSQELCGMIARVADGETLPFSSAEELIAYLVESRALGYGVSTPVAPSS